MGYYYNFGCKIKDEPEMMARLIKSIGNATIKPAKARSGRESRSDDGVGSERG